MVRILEGEVTLAELEKVLSEIFCKEWPWQIRELDVGRFLVRFPPHKRVDDIKNGLEAWSHTVNLKRHGCILEVCHLSGVPGKFLHKWCQVWE